MIRMHEMVLQVSVELNQDTFKVQEASKERRMCKVPCAQVFDEMFSGKIDEMKNGNLRYIL